MAAMMTDAASSDHFCSWQSQVVALARANAAQEVALAEERAKVAQLQQQIETYKRLFEAKSEKMPPPADELKRRGDLPKLDQAALRDKRAEGRKWKEELPTNDVVHLVPEDLEPCEHCGEVPARPMPDEVSYTIDLVPARVVRHRHLQHKVRCGCGSCIVTAPPPARIGDKVQYGPRLAASLIAAKCLDAAAIERYAKGLERIGVPISANTLFDLFHRSAEMITRLYELLVAQVQQHDIVQADETRIQTLDKGKTRRAWIWVFIAGDVVVYKYSASRSGETAQHVLGASGGTLVVDGYTGYNQVTTPAGRERAGCMAHGRRGLFDASKSAPEMAEGLALILDLYKVEHEAKAKGIGGTAAHAELRRKHSAPVLAKLHAWLLEQQALQLPESKAGQAVGYMVKQWDYLTRFVANPKVPIDNNLSERMLRVVARGRATYLFVGNDASGQNLAMLMSLVHTAYACGHNPEAYMADVLLRILGHPVSRLSELLPQNWRPPGDTAGPEPSPEQHA